MDIKYCDICGCLITKNYKLLNILDMELNRENGIQNDKFTLCNECLKDLISSLGNKRRENYENILKHKGV